VRVLTSWLAGWLLVHGNVAALTFVVSGVARRQCHFLLLQPRVFNTNYHLLDNFEK
jgi:hypothetical protein